MDNLTDLQYIYPEIVLGLFFVLAVLVDSFVDNRAKHRTTSKITILGLLVTFVVLIMTYSDNAYSAFSSTLAVDPLAFFFKLIFVLTALVTALLSYTGYRSGEYYILLLAVTLGTFFVAGATDLIMIFLAIELVSLSSFILVGYLKADRRSSEASLKYVIFSAFASGTMLYGMTLLYGITGSTKIYAIRDTVLAGDVYNMTLFIGALLLMVGFGFKIAFAPFHWWLPDVYEGAPTPIAGFLSVGSKAAGFAVFIRVFYTVFAEDQLSGVWQSLSHLEWPLVVAIISAVTMTLGNMSALVQNNIRRLLAYSTIAHAGYMLMGMVTLTDQGLSAVLFYFATYLLTNLGAFGVLYALVVPLGGEGIEQYRGLGSRAPFAAAAMTVFLFSLTGLPPTVGFLGKLYLFAAVIDARIYWLVVIGALNTVVSLYYYARIIKAMYLEAIPKTKPTSAVALARLHTVVLAILVVPTIALTAFWAPLKALADSSLRMFLP